MTNDLAYLGYDRSYDRNMVIVQATGPDLIKLFWRSVTVRQKFRPMKAEEICHVTILLAWNWLTISA